MGRVSMSFRVEMTHLTKFYRGSEDSDAMDVDEAAPTTIVNKEADKDDLSKYELEKYDEEEQTEGTLLAAC